MKLGQHHWTKGYLPLHVCLTQYHLVLVKLVKLLRQRILQLSLLIIDYKNIGFITGVSKIVGRRQDCESEITKRN